MSDHGQRIIKLEVSNAMRVRAIEITPTGDVVVISGKNGQGKTSLMQAIEWGLRGGAAIPDEPIRKGQKEAKVRITLDDIVISRTIRRRADGTIDNGEIRVEAADGSRKRNAHQLIQSMLGKRTIDPISFARDKPAGQFETLKQFVPDINFAAIEGANQKDYDARTEVNRDARTARAAAEQISVPDGTPPEPVDESNLVAQLEAAGKTNADIETRKTNRAAAVEKIAELRQRAAGQQVYIDTRATEITDTATARVANLRAEIDRMKESIARMEAEIETVSTRADEDIKQARATHTAERDRLITEADALQAKLDSAGALPDPIDTAAVRTAIENARKTNGHVANRKRRDALLKEAIAAEAKSADLTAAMEAREAAKEKAIAESALPVPGIGFGKNTKGDPIVTLNGFPFGQASGAEQLRASLGVAMAESPGLRVVLIRNGNDLDPEGMKIVAEMATERGYQVFIETCHESDQPAFVIEDGRLRDAPAEEKAA